MAFNSFKHIQVAWEEAENQRSQGNLLGAYDIYRNILEQRLISGTQFIAADTTVIQALADLTILFGQFQVTDDLLCGLEGLYTQASNYPLAFFTILKRIQLALDRGLLPQAHNLLGVLSPQIGDIESINISSSGLIKWEMTCHWEQADIDDQKVLFSHLYLAMGRLLSALGQYSDALTTLNRGLFYTQPEYPSLARQNALPLKFAIVAAHLEKGELETARIHLTILRNQFDENQQPEALIRWLELSGRINLLQGQLGESLEQFKRVEQECRELGIRRAAVQATLNLAHVLIPLNQTSLAKDYLNAALTDVQKLQDEELLQRTRLLLRLADARGISLASESPTGLSVSEMHKGRQSSNLTPKDDEEEDLLFTSQSANYLVLFDDRVLEFHWFLSRFELNEAYQKLTNIQEAFQYSDSQLIQLKIKIIEGILAYYKGCEYQDKQQLHWAASILEESRAPLRKLNLKPELWQVQRFLLWCFTRLNYPTNIQEQLTQENDELLTELTTSLSPENQATFLLNKWTAEEEYFARQIDQLQRLRILTKGNFFLRPWREGKLKHQLHHLLERIDRYKDTLTKRIIQNRNENELISVLPATFFLSRIFNHPRNRITLAFLVLPDRVLVTIIGWLIFDFRVISTTRLEVRNLVQSWYRQISGIYGIRDLSDSAERELEPFTLNNILNRNQEISFRLSDLLQLEFFLEKLPKRIKAITIIPDDILHGFPFATLIYQGNYIIKKYALSISYESTLQSRTQLKSLREETALLVGVSQGTKQIPALPAVREELQRVRDWFNHCQLKASILQNNEAQKIAVLERLENAKFLHIACHGTFNYNSPDQSGLVLIPNPQQSEEILSLRELSYLHLTQLYHATLSSCSSADHFISPGRWVISLPETLWRSGVHSILGCLWEVHDQVAVEFMTRFYHYLEKLPRDEALRQTQLECIQGKLPNPQNLPLANPIFWSGFNLYGDFRKLSLFTG